MRQIKQPRKRIDPGLLELIAVAALALFALLSIIALHCCGGCASAPREMVIYPSDPPPLDLPALPELVAEDDECPGVASVKTGSPMPFTAEDGTAMCRGLIVPKLEALTLSRRSDELLPACEARLERERQGRLEDRRIGQWTVNDMAERLKVSNQEADRLRIAVPFAALGSLVVGLLVGIAAEDLAEVVP